MKTITAKEIRHLQKKILSWCAHHKRDLPWRQTTDPYKILVSEVMLQQTQVSRVVPKYQAFLSRYPTLASLAHGTKKSVLTLWSGLGYNSRALRLWQLAKMVARNHGGRLPRSAEGLRALPGIGPYTQAAIQIFAWNMDTAAIDTNIRRILLHELRLLETMSLQELHGIAMQCLPRGKSRIWHNALMDYGALMLTSRTSNIKPLSKQTTFKKSKRYYRGQILKRVLAQKQVTIAELTRCYPDAPFPLSSVAQELAADGLLRFKNNLLQI